MYWKYIVQLPRIIVLGSLHSNFSDEEIAAKIGDCFYRIGYPIPIELSISLVPICRVLITGLLNLKLKR